MSAEGIVNKHTKGGWIVAKFHTGGFITLNHPTSTIGANTAGETVPSMNIISAEVNCGGANNIYFTIKRGANTVLVLSGQDYFDLSDSRIIDNMGGEPQANVVVTKTGAGPSTLILKLHKVSAIAGGSSY